MTVADRDRLRTIENRRRLFKNENLLYWYRNLYAHQFLGLGDIGTLRVLEVGSGTSPLQHYYPTVLTSDVLALDYLNFCFDCHKIDDVRAIPDGSIDVITVTNVLHHLNLPIIFLIKAATKLKKGGTLIMAEPYFSWLSRLLYQYVHHEHCSFTIEEPVITEIDGPLTSANSAISYAIFFSDRGWDRNLREIYKFDLRQVLHFTSLSYFITGGISHRFPIPNCIYKCLFKIDYELAKLAPQIFSSFFVLGLTKKNDD